MTNERSVETGRIVSQCRITGVSSFWQQRRSDPPLRRKPALMNTTSLLEVCYFYLSGVYRCISFESVSEILTAASCSHNVKFSSTELCARVCECTSFRPLLAAFPHQFASFLWLFWVIFWVHLLIGVGLFVLYVGQILFRNFEVSTYSGQAHSTTPADTAVLNYNICANRFQNCLKIQYYQLYHFVQISISAQIQNAFVQTVETNIWTWQTLS